MGEVLYDGKRVSQLSGTGFSRMISAVSQNSAQYHLPVRDNIGIHNPDMSVNDEKITQVLKQVGLKQFLIPEEYDRWLGREFGGRELSGGQWQKLSIAGAISKNHQLLFLDEPTSALDPVSEYEILKQFVSMMQGKTAVVVSHRVGLCNLADKVVFMKEGQIKAVGSHQELMESCTEYVAFYNEQAKWYKM